MTVKLVLKNGSGILYAGNKTAERLLRTGLYRVANGESYEPEKESQEPADETNNEPQGDDTQLDAPKLPEPSEGQEQRPAPAVVRAWAKENGVEVSAKGRVSDEVYEKYAEAHKE